MLDEVLPAFFCMKGLEMNTLTNLANTLLSTEKLVLGKPEYQRITFEEMRDDVVSRATATLEALQVYQEGELQAPMAWTGQNAIIIKIGYGSKNEALWKFENEIGETQTELRANARTREEQRDKAISFFEKAIPAIEQGALDKAIKDKLESYRERGERGKEARKEKAERRKKAQQQKLAIAAE
jgi:hypothetical protein